MLTSLVHAHITSCPHILPIVQSSRQRDHTLFPGFKIMPYLERTMRLRTTQVLCHSITFRSSVVLPLISVSPKISSLLFSSLLFSSLLFSSLLTGHISKHLLLHSVQVLIQKCMVNDKTSFVEERNMSEF